MAYGVQRDLCDLMHIPTMTAHAARALLAGGVPDPIAVAAARPAALADLLIAAVPFRSSERDAAMRYR
jgi:hypothetical protein